VRDHVPGECNSRNARTNRNKLPLAQFIITALTSSRTRFDYVRVGSCLARRSGSDYNTRRSLFSDSGRSRSRRIAQCRQLIPCRKFGISRLTGHKLFHAPRNRDLDAFRGCYAPLSDSTVTSANQSSSQRLILSGSLSAFGDTSTSGPKTGPSVKILLLTVASIRPRSR
jgi:hypothetical protein